MHRRVVGSGKVIEVVEVVFAAEKVRVADALCGTEAPVRDDVLVEGVDDELVLRFEGGDETEGMLVDELEVSEGDADVVEVEVE